MEHPTLVAELSAKKPPSLLALLFAWQGRISRSEYWLRGFLPVGAAWILVGLCGMAERRATGWQISGLEIVGSLFLCWPGSILILKRMRDRDLSLGLLWLLIVPIFNVFYGIWLTIDLGCVRGTRGPNRYGGDPLADLESPDGWPVDRVVVRTLATIAVGAMLATLTAMQIREMFFNPILMQQWDEIRRAFM